jgi:hypothetical protein
VARFKFKTVPANIGILENISPSSIYDYATSFRSVYTRSMSIVKKFNDPSWPNHEEITQLYGKVQSLAVQIALSNELLIKAILLATTGTFSKEHNLKKLVNSLDNRYIEIIKHYLEKNGLKKNKWDEVLNISALTFVDARYGFEGKSYAIDFRTHQLLNEVLDDIYNNSIPDWTKMTKDQQADVSYLKKEIDLIFDVDYQKEQARQLRLWQKILKR